MLFEIGDKVRIKSKKELKKNGYSTEYFLDSAKCEDVVISSSIINIQLDKLGIFNENDLQLILESPKLSLKLSQKRLTLKVKILHQDDSLRCDNIIVKYEDFTLESYSCPEIDPHTLYIKGTNTKADNVSPKHKFDSQEELDNFVSALRVMMKDEKLQ